MAFYRAYNQNAIAAALTPPHRKPPVWDWRIDMLSDAVPQDSLVAVWPFWRRMYDLNKRPEYTTTSAPPDSMLQDLCNNNPLHGYYNDGRERIVETITVPGVAGSYDGSTSDTAWSFAEKAELQLNFSSGNDGSYLIAFYTDNVTKKTALIGQVNGGLATIHQYGCAIGYTSGTARAWRCVNDSTKNASISISTGYHVLACSFSGTSGTICLDGQLATGTISSTGQDYDFGIGNSGHAYVVTEDHARLSGSVSMAAQFRYPLSDDELVRLTLDPYILLRPDPAKVFPIVPGSGAAPPVASRLPSLALLGVGV